MPSYLLLINIIIRKSNPLLKISSKITVKFAPITTLKIAYPLETPKEYKLEQIETKIMDIMHKNFSN